MQNNAVFFSGLMYKLGQVCIIVTKMLSTVWFVCPHWACSVCVAQQSLLACVNSNTCAPLLQHIGELWWRSGHMNVVITPDISTSNSFVRLWPNSLKPRCARLIGRGSSVKANNLCASSQNRSRKLGLYQHSFPKLANLDEIKFYLGSSGARMNFLISIQLILRKQFCTPIDGNFFQDPVIFQ